ncbi:tail fiber assembly protein [Photorhabdus sp. RM323S]|uniref:tail fiber assembly protein n=1 Tax=Photorhabdus sp. RM323S TaxID=3342828 RepID=UPI0036DF2040
MINYYFDSTKPHRPFTGSADANPGSESPVNALRIEPEFKAGFWPCEKSGQWELIENKKGITIYCIENGESQENQDVIIPDGFTEQSKPSKYHKWNGKWVISEGDKEKWKKDIQQELVNDAEDKKQQLMSDAIQKIVPLQYAVETEMASEAEKTLLLDWKKYVVLLNRVDVLQVPDIGWPEKPME